MGEAKRRKQRLGAEYGQPLGLTTLERRALIQENLPQLLSQHYQACGYPDFCKSPNSPKIGTSSQTISSFHFMPSLIQHWQQTFDFQSPHSALSQAMKAILEDAPMFLTDIPSKGLGVVEAVSPIIPFPQARDYFRQLFKTRHFSLSQHYILLADVLSVLATEKCSSLLQQLLTSEATEILNGAFDEREDWLLPYIKDDGWIDLSDEVVFIVSNRAIMGLITLLLTLPWEIELKKLQVPSSVSPD